MKRKRSHAFAIGLTVYTFALCLVCAVGLLIFSEYIHEYELSRPEHCVEGFIEADAEALRGLFGDLDNGDEIYKNYIEGKKLSYVKKSAVYTDKSPVYDVLADGVAICAITLKQDGKTGFGFPVYAVDKATPAEVSVTESPAAAIREKTQEVAERQPPVKKLVISAPRDASVYFDGKILGEASKTASEVLPEALMKAEKIDTAAVYNSEYTVEYSGDIPAVSAVLDGTELARGDDGSGNIVFVRSVSPELSAVITERTLDFVRKYIKFTADGYTDTDANHAAVMKFFIDGTDTYRRMKLSYESISWNSTYSSVKYSALECRNIVCYGEDCVSCEVFYDVTLERYNATRSYSDTYRLVFVKTGGEWLIDSLEF